MTLASTKLVPELQYWFNKALIEGEINKEGIPIPVTFDPIYLPQKSFIELLFNENYSWSTYNYLYEDDTNKPGWPYFARTRLMVYPASAKYLNVDEESTCCYANPFLLQSDDLKMLDALLAFRNDATSVVIVTDSTSETLYVDSTSITTFSQLNTPLSKLIFIYLDLKRYGRITLYDNENIISEGGLLESCFEVYLADQMFRLVSSRS